YRPGRCRRYHRRMNSMATRRAHRLRIVAVALSVLGVVGAVEAGVYRWTDANGTVHYSQSPPPTGSYQTLREQAVPASSEVAPARRSAQEFLEKAEQSRAEQDKLRSDAATEKQQKQARCQQ